MIIASNSHQGQRTLRRAGRGLAFWAGAVTVAVGSQLVAADIDTMLFPGQTVTNSTSIGLPPMPNKADVLFSFDCTGSMGSIIASAKRDALNLIAALKATSVDYRFGVSSFRDYPAAYTSCEYTNTYGSLGIDYPYRLDQVLTTNSTAVSAAINTLQAGGGFDGPESYTRAMYESYADPNVIWRTDSRKIYINFGDAVPHDCNLNEGIPGYETWVYSTGVDPGRDGKLFTPDDLDLHTVLAGMASNQVVLLAARSDTYYSNYWSNWASRTGGKAFETTSGTLTQDLLREITNAMAPICITNVQVVAEPPSFNAWVTSVPNAYATICSGETQYFSFAITVPANEPPGEYAFSLYVMDGNGVTYKTNTVAIRVSPMLPLPPALNNSNLTWTTTAGRFWFGQTNVCSDGFASGRSYFIGDDSSSRLRTTVTGPGTLSFYWKVSSQTNADVLSFSSAGGGLTNLAAISGEEDWQNQTYYLGVGSQTLDWLYTKDTEGSAGLDAGYVDVVTYTNGGTKPFITAQPEDQALFYGTPVSFSVTAKGTPSLAYQWYHNGTALAGQTSAALTLTNASSADLGGYTVVIANSFGSTTSSVASIVLLKVIANGDNSFQQLEVSGLATNAVGISAGTWHSLALREDGRVVAWGYNYGGQCDVPANLPVAMAVAAGGYHSLALLTNGTVRGWGDDSGGQASPPPGLSNVVAIAAGSWHSLALRSNRTVVGWGVNSSSQLSIPSDATNVIAVAAGGNHSLALRTDGRVIAWGDNRNAWGDFVGQSMPPGSTLTNIVGIAAGEFHSLAVKQDGTVVAWGDNSAGQSVVPTFSNALAVAGGSLHSVAVKGDGTATAWGSDAANQCAVLQTLSSVVAVSAGNAHTLLLLDNPPPSPQLLSPQRKNSAFTFKLQSALGKVYILEYKNSPTDPIWTPLTTFTGNGAVQTVSDPGANAARRFYRLRLR